MKMPDTTFHIQKRDRFRNTAEYLRVYPTVGSDDAAVQDYFYAAMHDIERFLSLFRVDGGNHLNRKRLIIDCKIVQSHGRVTVKDPSRLRMVAQVERTVDNVTELCFFSLYAMRQLKVYGTLPRNMPIPPTVGGSRFANALDVSAARMLFLKMGRSLVRHESRLRNRGLL